MSDDRRATWRVFMSTCGGATTRLFGSLPPGQSMRVISVPDDECGRARARARANRTAGGTGHSAGDR